MYQILCDDYVIHDPRIDELQVVNAKCELEVNKTGALTFQIHPLHPYYDILQKHTSQITLLQDGEVLFRGRVLNDDISFEKIKTVECEGELSYLLDSIQKPKYYAINNSNKTIRDFLTTIINNHNSQVDDFKKFTVGNVTVTYEDDEALSVKANYDNTLSLINTNLIENLGGYLIIRYEGNNKYLDYVADYTNVCNQVIMFGENIIDLKNTIKGENIYTAILPSGKSIVEGVEPTLKDLADGTYDTMIKKDDYVYNPEGVNAYGWIWRHIEYKTPSSSRLLQYSIADLKNSVNVEFTLELTALDLHLIDVNIDRIKVGDSIRCVSKPHDIDLVMLVKSMSINLDDPSKTSIKLVVPSQAQYISPGNLTDSVNKNKKQTDKSINDTNDNFEQLLSDNNDELKQWVSDNFYPATGGEVDLSDYAKTADVDTKINDLKDWTDDNYVPRNSTSDLSAYAKIVDVNTAFDELATVLEGV